MGTPSRIGAVLAALLGSLLTGAAWLAVTAPLALGLLHPRPIAPSPASVATPTPETVPLDGRPVAAVLLSQAGTEVTDFLAPYAVLAASGAFTVHAVAPATDPAPTNGGLGIVPALTFAALDARYPRGVDVVVIPNVLDPESPVLRDWVLGQAARGALVVSICEGARLLAETGLLDGREATSHFAALGALRAAHPAVRWRDDRRWVEDGPLLTSAGVTAAIDASLRIVERRAGAEVAERTAAALALSPPRDPVAAGPALSAGDVAIALLQGAFAWPKRRIAVPLADGVDEMRLAATLDAWPRTFAAWTDTTTRDRRPVRSRHDLTLLPSSAPSDDDPPHLADAGVGSPFDHVLTAIAHQLGGRTARLVAVQLEYPAAGLALATRPTPVAALALRALLLVAAGAAAGLGARAVWRRRRGGAVQLVALALVLGTFPA
ncbi:MAG: DJ-1/PfpI family protein [bacterium]|nr:DJ-1/PfpI family protein [bacterium]